MRSGSMRSIFKAASSRWRGGVAILLSPSPRPFSRAPSDCASASRCCCWRCTIPIRLAEEIATLDVLSDGRVDFGISRGGNGRYLEAYGVPAENVNALFHDNLALIRRAWSDEKIAFGENAALHRAEAGAASASADLHGHLHGRDGCLGGARGAFAHSPWHHQHGQSAAAAEGLCRSGRRSGARALRPLRLCERDR